MRAARLISLVLVLQTHESMTAAELADELGVSERTVYRDVLELSSAGIPIYADKGRRGGYRLVQGYRTRLNGLTRLEAEALFLFGLELPAREMGLAPTVDAAARKVLASLPPSHRDAPALASQRFFLDAPGWFTAWRPPPLLEKAARAVWQDECVDVSHARFGSDEVTVRRVEPYGLVLKGSRWYLVARAGSDFRTYRVDRIRTIEPTGRTFVRDEAFRLPSFWAEQTASFEASILTETITVRLSPAGLAALDSAVEPAASSPAKASAGPPDSHGWVRITLPVESTEIAYHQLMQLGPEAEVIEPVRLRDRFAAAAERFAALYSARE